MEKLLRTALADRDRLDLDKTDALRLLDGAGDGLDGVWIDCFAGQWVVATLGTLLPQGLLKAIQAVGQAEAVWWKRLRQDEDQKDAPELLWARNYDSAQNGDLVVLEGGVRYLVDFDAGYSQGIFLDQRENRQRVREASEGRAVLNLFSYTCGFSVVAALGGGSATSLDLSQPYLDWGKRNFEANDMDPADHFWCRGDAFDWLDRFARSGRTFGGVVIDPPTFSRSGKGKKRRTFRVEDDYHALVAKSAAVLDPGGWILATTNCRRLRAKPFRLQVERGLAEAGLQAEVEEYPMPGEYTGDKYLKTCWVEG